MNTGFLLDPQTLTAEVEGQAIKLTPTEWQLLYYLYLNEGKMVTRTELKERFPTWNADNCIDVTISHIRKKIGKDFIKSILNEGYMFHQKEATQHG